MHTSHQTLRRLVYFAEIAEAGTIRGAAARLNLSVPVLSEALSELEAELGVSLATRTTRKFELTAAGVEVHRAARDIRDTAQSLGDIAKTNAPLSGTLSMTVPVELAGFWLHPHLSAFQSRHPQLRFDIDVTDKVVDMRAGPVELAIRTTYVSPGQKSTSSINLPLTVVTRSPVPVALEGSVNLPLIDSDLDRQLVATSRHSGVTTALGFTGTHRVTSRLAALAFVRAGMGAAMVIHGSVADEIKRGELFELMPDHSFGSIDLKTHFR
ncbi:MAG: LysR family transcriptional regulator, partial [Pseudomonadota bacterium]